MKFLDEAKVYIRSGDGGAGWLRVVPAREVHRVRRSERRRRRRPGRRVWIECVQGLNTLIDYRYQQHFKAKKGEHGMGSNCHGASGADAVLKVPAGTQVLAEDGETLIADMTEIGQRVRLAKGGNGGFGKRLFHHLHHRAPKHANPGLEGQEMWIWLRLKLIAEPGSWACRMPASQPPFAASRRPSQDATTRSRRSIPASAWCANDQREFVWPTFPA